jgi:hypothetical protein
LQQVLVELHLWWRLTKPATGDALARLKTLRRLATRLVGADASNITIVHPIRWPGSVHRKGEPKLVQIIAATENEIDLDDALEELQSASPRTKGRTEGRHRAAQTPSALSPPTPTKPTFST